MMFRTIAARALLLVSTCGWVAPARAVEFLPVWVFLDADTPVVKARVRVDTEGPGHLHESNGRSVALTNENGLVVLEFETLPRSFTVIALGGDAEGRRLGRTAELRAEVARSEADTIVYINPVTTLAARDRELHPELSRGAAAQMAKETLGIPGWHDITRDLQGSDRWFGGDAFLKHARQRGGVGRLIDQLAERPDVRRRYRDHDEDGGGVPQIAVPGFVQDAALGLLKQLASSAAGSVLPKLFGLVGLPEDLIDNGDIKEIRSRFTAIDKQLVEIKQDLKRLETKIDKVNYNVVVGWTKDDVADINTYYDRFKVLANMDARESTRKGYGEELLRDIKLRIDPIPGRLNEKLGGGIQLADNVLIAASKLVASKAETFFGPEDSALVQSIYAYYADLQSRAGVLLMAYWTSKPSIYSPATIAIQAGAITTNLRNQAELFVKPAVPDGVFIDTRTRTMWTRTLVQRVDGLTFDRSISGKPQSWAGFSDFRVPSFAELQQLIQGRDGNPAEWLRQRAKMAPGVDGRLWAQDSLVVRRKANLCTRYGCTAGFERLLKLFDLSRGEIYDHCPFGERYKCPDRYSENTPLPSEARFLMNQSALVIYKRPLGTQESYWF
jgi:hypothetical protein